MRCDDCRTTEAARATRGGVPLTRRSLLQAGLAGTLAVYGLRATPLREQLAAAEAAASSAPGAPILVSVFLPGGVDLLDTLVPVGQAGRYADLRPGLKIQDAVPLAGADGIGLHPALSSGHQGGLAGLAERGRIGFLPGIDYAAPDLSHFSSRHFWETGTLSARNRGGWLGRWVDRHGGPDNPFQAISMSGALSPVLRGSRHPVAAIDSPSDAGWWTPGVWGKWEVALGEHLDALAAHRPRAAGPAAVHSSLRQVRTVAKTLAPYERRKGAPDPLAGPVAYPEDNELAERLRGAAALLALPLGTRVITVDDDGDWDTHDDQRESLRRGLKGLSEALAAFQADLEARGLADRVLTLVWTEFGRRAQENASGGTDHGAGGLAFVMGTRARAGQLSPYPSLTRFDRHDNLQVTVDFRRVYASLLEQWMGTGAEILPDHGRVGRLRVVA